MNGLNNRNRKGVVLPYILICVNYAVTVGERGEKMDFIALFVFIVVQILFLPLSILGKVKSALTLVP